MSKYIIFLITLLLASSVLAQRGDIRGVITENGEPLPGVNILLIGTTIGDVSDIDGIYEIRGIDAGKYRVRYSAVGYETHIYDLTVEPNRTLEFDVSMEQKLIEIGTVEVIDDKVQDQDDTRTSLINLRPERARVLPGAVTDVLRTLQALPGVLAPNDFSSQLIVRGSGPDQNLIIMDDVEIFNPYRLYGVISMFNPEAVSDVNLITGGFPARYGDRLSAVLDVTNRQGPRDVNLQGNLNASIVAANLVLEGKNPFDIEGSWLINSRRTYYDLVIEPFVKNSGLVEDDVAFPNFYDVQAKFAFGPFNGHKFLLNGILSRDAVNLVSGGERTSPDSVAIIDDTNNDVASFAWHYSPNKRFLNKFIASWYQNKGNTDFDSELLDFTLNEDDFNDVDPDTLAPYLVNFGFKSNFEFRKYALDNKSFLVWGENNNELEFGAGVDFMRTTINFDFELDPQIRSFFDSNPNIKATFDDLQDVKDYTRYRAYADNKFAIGKKLFLQPGIRFDYYNILEKGYIAPRISLAYALDDVTTVRAVWGYYYQSPGYEKLRDRNTFLDFAPQYTDNLEAERATHYVLSFDRWLTNEWKAKFETYYKKFDDLIVQEVVTGTNYYTEAIPGRDSRYPNGWTRPVEVFGDSVTQVPINNSTGEAYGFEFMIEKRNLAGTNNLNGWVSYSLAWANRYEDNRTIPFRYDQRHTLNIVLDYRINSWLDLGVRFQYGSGFPITEAVGIRPRVILADNNGDGIPETPEIATRINAGGEEEVIYDVDLGGYTNRNQGRKPIYHRLDLRLSAKADYWDLDWVFYLDVINVYNRSNVIGYDYYVTKDLTLKRTKQTMFPILPTLGFNLSF